ncbi:primosomal protein N' family DNA-binding protein [Gulosibacter sp. ACHW.36C]|uniref:Probable replication restart protein PriA n=1 Tax=Gulosibacter sediminis TaxID=1729695 RepID=A0ABY4MUS2_9MICO|nr:primosomal protein N' [Gulosibacter sediminis]UQN13789.1 primosomal protein N' [Gulosibacter sediminis]
MSHAVARVVLESPLPQLDRVFEYEIPAELGGQLGEGMRVKVPLRTGGRVVGGYVVELTDEPEYTGRLAKVDQLVSGARVLPPELARLARAVADRQAGTMSDVLRLAIPARSARLEARWLDDETGERAARAAEATPPSLSAATSLEASYGQDFLDALRGETPVRWSLRVPVGVAGVTPRALRTLVEAAAELVATGRSAIVLVPDYRDLDLAIAAAEELLPAVAVRRFDSRLKPMPRYEQFLRALEPVPQLIIGTRAAVYAPAHRLGGILMWDDDDESFREPHAPYAHAREVALMRAQQQGCSVILAGHAPSLEATRLLATGWLHEARPLRPQRPKIIPAAATLGDESAQREARIPSSAWRAARDGLDHGPVLVQVGRAGYRPYLACASCRTPASCTFCGGRLQQHGPGSVPSCAVCGRPHADWRCRECGDAKLRAGGIGHQRTAEELGRAFPGARVVLADGEERLVAVDAAPQLVVATRGAEPVPEGGYQAVLLLDVEGALARESLGATEAAMRAWSNAAALVADDGAVILAGQPSPPLIALRDWQQAQWASAELAERRELLFPPAVRVGVITGSELEVDAAVRRLTDLDGIEVQVLGPVPDPEQHDRSRAVIRFSYRDGANVAAALKSELVAQASAGRRRAGGRGAHASTLRVQLDAPDVF